MKRPAGMQQVAEAAGVHRTTVSLALRGSTRLPEATRARIRAAADSLGYRPNPLVAALMTARAGRRRAAFQAALAFVSADGPPRGGWERGGTAYAQMFRGARTRAEECGYALALFQRKEAGMSAARFSAMLAARGIHGLLIAPQSGAGHRMEIEWERFSVVELGYNLVAPHFHRVVHDYFHAMRLALARCRERGCRRIGLVLTSLHDDKSHHLWRAAYLDAQQAWPARDRLPPLIEGVVPPARLRDWAARTRPDAICSVGSGLLDPVVRAAGLAVPGDLGFVDLACHRREGGHTGIYQNWDRMGATAVDQLIALLHRNERGVPEQAHSTLTGGLWVEGNTLHPEPRKPGFL